MPRLTFALGLAAGLLSACEGGGSGNFIVEPPANPVFPLDLQLGRLTPLAGSGVTDALKLDLDGNGMSDLVEIARSPDLLRVDFGADGGTVQLLPLPGVPLRLTPGDFDGDGDLELVVLCRMPSIVPPPGGELEGGFDTPTRVVLFDGAGEALLEQRAEVELGSISAYCSAVRLSEGVERDELLLPLVYERRIALLRLEEGGLFEVAAPAGLGFSDTIHGPLDVVPFDVGADGLIDLLIAELPTLAKGDGRILLQRQTSIGEFAAPEVLLDQLGIPRVRVLGDLDRDGDLDLGITDAGDDQLGVALLFQEPTTFANVEWVPTAGPSSDVLATDLNGDGILDLVVGLPFEQAVSVRRGFSSPQGQPPVFGAVRLFLGGPDIRRLDRGMGAQDPVEVVTASGRLELDVLPGLALKAPSGYIAGDDLVIMNLGDLDADGLTDAVCVDRQQLRLIYMRGLPDGRFEKGDTLALTGGIEESPGDLALGDLDGDSFLDTAVCLYQFSELRTFSGGGTLSPSGAVRQIPVGDRPLGLELADLDLDGDLDVAVGLWGKGAIQTLRNDGLGNLELWNSLDLPGRPTDVASADVDLDGRPELVFGLDEMADIGAGIGIMETDDVNGEPALIWSYLAELDLAPLRLVVHDWNGDGKPDIGCDQPSPLATSSPLFLSGSDATTFDRVDLELGPWPGTPLPLDVDADGRADLLSTLVGGSLNVLGNDGKGQFNALPPGEDDGRTVPFGVSDARLEDLDADGKPELVFIGPFSRAIWVGLIEPIETL